MPPFVGRKRGPSTPPASSPSTPPKRVKLSEVLDAPPKDAPNLQKLKEFTLGEDESDSSLSEVDSEAFEDVLQARKVTLEAKEEDEDEDFNWEDAIMENGDGSSHTPHVPMAGGNLELTFSKAQFTDGYSSLATTSVAKKGPSRRERRVRIQTHCLHVQFLLYHNAIRNKWIRDKTVQVILVKQLPAGIKREVEKWRVASGFEVEPCVQELPSSSKVKKRGRPQKEDERSLRDWGKPSQRLEKGKPDLSHGDPLIPLMKVLSAYWKKRFYINAPGLRKQGYSTKAALQRKIASFQNNQHHPEHHGERVRDLEEFRDLARKCEGSRDIGAQLFTALLAGLGIESRLVASLQPSGFGWTKGEEAVPCPAQTNIDEAFSTDEVDEADESRENKPASTKKSVSKTTKAPSRELDRKTRKRSSLRKGAKDVPIDLDTFSESDDVSGDASVVDVTPSATLRGPLKYDTDLPFPIYWTEAVSPITHTVLPVSPLVLKTPVASTPEVLMTFEPRGAKADKARLVMAYVIAYSEDGSAKDVTTRYLRRRMWPGKTKGFRMPVEKVPVYDKHGKIKKHEEYDWFKTAMSGYRKSDKMRTAVDDVEESTDLVPQRPERKETKGEGDTLQSLKASADFVLEKFLRREEALRPDAKPVKMFVSGKDEKLKGEPVYRRADVERCLSAESWHKEGRMPKLGETPLKFVPVRAVTLTRKREVEEAQRITGKKPNQGLYSWDQTEYIIPPPILDGIIPKNAYGNIDCFVPSMVPKGAVHIPLRGTVRICKKLDIDFAEAVTGFEFGNKRAVPVVTGVVVAKENEEDVRNAWEVYAEEQRKKEEGKQKKAVLDSWRKMLMGLRINERVQEVYGDETGEVDASHGMSKATKKSKAEGEAEVHQQAIVEDHATAGGGFLLPHEDDELNASCGDLVMEHHENVPAKTHGEVVQYPTPISLSSVKTRKQRPQRLVLDDASESSELSDVSTTREVSEMDEDFAPGKQQVATRRVVPQVDIPKPKAGSGRKSQRVKADGIAHGDSSSKSPSSHGGPAPPRKESPRGRPRKGVTKHELCTPRRRTLRRGSTLVASPYFEGNEKS